LNQSTLVEGFPNLFGKCLETIVQAAGFETLNFDKSNFSSSTSVTCSGQRRTMSATVPTVTLNDGIEIPQLGFGTFKVADTDVEAAVTGALRIGYRHIDTAAVYGNEKGVGKALKHCDIPRDELFITTKLWNDKHKRRDAHVALEASLERLGLDYVDLYLIHWPATVKYGDAYIEAWDVLQRAKENGLIRSIGVSNFNVEHLDKLTGAVPSVDQIELHPSFTQTALSAELKSRGIAVEAWSPLGQGEDLSESTLIQIAHGLHRTVAQVIIRWHLQLGHIVIPKTITSARIAENFKVFDFELSPDQMATISNLDTNNRIGADPVTADF
jgi:2,5-diketo-D-gluconate reductase A